MKNPYSLFLITITIFFTNSYTYAQSEPNNSWIEGMQDYTVNFNTVVNVFEDEYRGKP